VKAVDALVAREVVARVRDELGPVAAFKSVHVVKALPKTRSGKTLRATIRAIANGETVAVPATIEDPAALEHIYQSVAKTSMLEG
jgi:propionyl-CoA synthetase